MARILLAEDETGVREFITRALRSVGHEVEAVSDGSEALTRLGDARALGVKYDLLLTDILMPVMDGISLSLSAARDEPDLLIVLMTGYSDQRERTYGIETIIQDILLKPFTLDELIERVDEVLNARNAQ